MRSGRSAPMTSIGMVIMVINPIVRGLCIHYKDSLLLMAEIRRSPVEVGSLSMFIPLFIGFQHHPRWCKISAINSIKGVMSLSSV